MQKLIPAFRVPKGMNVLRVELKAFKRFVIVTISFDRCNDRFGEEIGNCLEDN